MFSVAVCDDDELLCEKIEACLKAYQPQGLVRCESYYSGEKLYADMLRGEAFDLIFLDIELKAMNGVNLGDKIRTELQDEKTHIVYISAKSEYAMELFAVRPLNFLVKPVQERDIINNLEKAMKLSKYYDGYLKFQKGSELYSIAYEDIMYFNTSGRKYQALGLKDRLPQMSEAEQLELLATDGMLVKRPLLVGSGLVLAGFREKEWEAALEG